MESGAGGGYWQLGIQTVQGLAGAGVFGRKVQNYVNPPSITAPPMQAPVAAPVAGSQGTNPNATPSQVANQSHFAKYGKVYAIGGGVLLVIGALVLLRGKV